MPELPLVSYRRILRTAGIERVSKEALVALSVAVEDSALKLAGEAVEIAEDKPVTEKEIFSALGVTPAVEQPTIPLSPVMRFIHRAGAKRASEDAVRGLATIIEKETVEMAVKARKFSRSDGRFTIKARDIFSVLEHRR